MIRLESVNGLVAVVGLDQACPAGRVTTKL